MNIQIFSIPKQFVIAHPDWLKTPDVNARVNQVVRSYFANWTLNHLSLAKKVSTVMCWISLVGTAVAGYIGFAIASSTGRTWDILYFPRFLAVSGISFVVCLIGYKAIRREFIARLEKKCLAAEDYLIPLKKRFKELEPLLAPFKDQKQPNHPVSFATYQSLYDQLQQLPANADVDQMIESLADELDALHLRLFGDLRRFGQGKQRTNYWIRGYFKDGLGFRLRHFYASAKTFQECFAKLQQDLQSIKLQNDIYVVATNLLYIYVHPANELSTADLLEQSRQSIAAFRSSLNL